MTSIPQNLRYLPHTLETRYHAVKTYRNGASVAFICRRYKVSKTSLMRWNKRFDGTKESLKDRSHRPLTPHPKTHTEQELNWIKNCIRRNPNDTLIEIFYKLKTNKGYDRHPCSLFRVLRKMGSFKLEFINQETFRSLEELTLKTKDYVHWWNHHRIHSTLNYQTPMTKRAIV